MLKSLAFAGTGVVLQGCGVTSTPMPTPSASQATVPTGLSTKLDLCKETANFRFLCRNEDPATLDELAVWLESSYPRILADLRSADTGVVQVEIYPDLDTFHAAVGMPMAPAWAIGTARTDRMLAIVSPDHPGPAHKRSEVIRAAVHELVHVITLRIAAGAIPPAWLWGGSGHVRSRADA